MKCKICNKPINNNTGYIHPDGCHYHDKCKPLPIPPMPQAPPQMCHKCDLPIYVSNTKKWPDGFYYHDMCSVDSDPPVPKPAKRHKISDVPEHAPGTKCDYSKNRLDLVLGGFSLALQEVGKVGTFGAKKYTDNGWIHVHNGINRYKSALLRHYFEDAAGHKTDDEIEFNNKKLHHMAAVAWNALAALDLMLRKEEAQHAQLEMDKQ